MTPAIVVVGSLNMDFVVRVRRLPAPGETLLGEQFQTIPGGKGANQAYAAAKLGANVHMIGRVGYDVFGDQLKASLAAAGTDVSRVHATKSAPTGVALIWVDDEGQNSIVVASGANFHIQPADAQAMRPAFNDARFALFQLETPLASVAAAMRVARECGAATILDPAPAQPLSRELLTLVDILTPNEIEASILIESLNPDRQGGDPPDQCDPTRAASEASGQESAQQRTTSVSERASDREIQTAQQLLALGPRAVILKLGARGCYYASANETHYVPGFQVDAVDTTAAGDTFNAAFAVALTEGLEIPEALRYANAAAALSVTKSGAQSSAPSHRDVGEFLSNA